MHRYIRTSVHNHTYMTWVHTYMCACMHTCIRHICMCLRRHVLMRVTPERKHGDVLPKCIPQQIQKLTKVHNFDNVSFACYCIPFSPRPCCSYSRVRVIRLEVDACMGHDSSCCQSTTFLNTYPRDCFNLMISDEACALRLKNTRCIPSSPHGTRHFDLPNTLKQHC